MSTSTMETMNWAKLIPSKSTHLWYQEVLNVKYNEPVEDAQAYLAEFDIELK